MAEAGSRLPENRDTPTMTTAITTQEEISPTWSSLNRETAGLRDNARFLHDDASELHHRTQQHDLDARTFAKARSSTQELLADLSTRGYSWRTIAQLAGVSVPALRKWRLGEGSSGENRRKIAQLVALTELLDEYHIADVPSWLEMPLSDAVRTTLIDVIAGGSVDLVLDFAANRVTDPQQLLDAFDPDWRSRRSDFEVYQAPDGTRSIRPKKA